MNNIYAFSRQVIFDGIVRIIRVWHASPMFTPEQCRAARGLLGWSQQQLADRARVGLVTVHQLEAGISQPRRSTLEVIQRAFEEAGVEFTDGEQPGVRFSKAAASRLRARTLKTHSGTAKSRRKKL
jgi:transcriptional regulator with XRE-family HTH domain